MAMHSKIGAPFWDAVIGDDQLRGAAVRSVAPHLDLKLSRVK